MDYHYRKVYLIVLLVAFLYSIGRSLMNVLEEPTTIEETVLNHNASFPSLTFCVRDTQPDNLTTFTELIDQLTKFFENKVSAKLSMYGKGLKTTILDLKNETVLINDLNSTFEYVWEVSVAMTDFPPYPLTPCITLNFPDLNGMEYLSQGYQLVGFTHYKINDDNLRY